MTDHADETQTEREWRRMTRDERAALVVAALVAQLASQRRRPRTKAGVDVTEEGTE